LDRATEPSQRVLLCSFEERLTEALVQAVTALAVGWFGTQLPVIDRVSGSGPDEAGETEACAGCRPSWRTPEAPR
jgi:hypothetical protein